MFNENSIHRTVQDIRYAGETPLLQYDILDGCTLLHVVRADSRYHSLSAARLAQILRQLDMRPLGTASVASTRVHLWTSLPPNQSKSSIVSILRERVKSNMVELRTELVPYPPIPAHIPRAPRLSDRDREILRLRLAHQGVRYPRPHEIAGRLGITVPQVNLTLQKIRRVLGIKSLKNAVEFRRAAQSAGLIPLTMEDF